MGTEGSGKAEVEGDWEKKEARLKGMGHQEDNQFITTNLMYSKQGGWLASLYNFLI